MSTLPTPPFATLLVSAMPTVKRARIARASGLAGHRLIYKKCVRC